MKLKQKWILPRIRKHLPMSKEELRKYHEQVVGSARVSENQKAYKRSRDKMKGVDPKC